MLDFLLSNIFSIVLTISFIAYVFQIIWIKTKKKKYFLISASVFGVAGILTAISYYISFYYSTKLEENFSKKIPKEIIVKVLSEIETSEENKNFVVFRDMIDYYINKEDLTEEEYFEIVRANKNADFKMAIQYSKQEIEDLNMLLKLMEDIKH